MHHRVATLAGMTVVCAVWIAACFGGDGEGPGGAGASAGTSSGVGGSVGNAGTGTSTGGTGMTTVATGGTGVAGTTAGTGTSTGGTAGVGGAGAGGGGGAGAGGTGAGGTGMQPACDCPATPPAPGSSCELCADLPACTYNDCAGTGRTVALCQVDMWVVETEACDLTDCDGMQCGALVCLSIQGQAAGDRRCADDPCGAAPLTCECAAALCTGEFNADACRITGPNRVSCYATSSGCTSDGICPP